MAQPNEPEIVFGPFHLDRANARLLRDGRPVALTPKSFDVLCFLASRPDRLVTKDELLNALWPDVAVTDASVKVCVREIRKALDDDPQSPSYIETVHRRGYRFIGQVAGDLGPQAPGATTSPAPPAAHFVDVKTSCDDSANPSPVRAAASGRWFSLPAGPAAARRHW